MKLTKETLKRIIKEEMSTLLNELGEPSFGNPNDPHDDMYRSLTGQGPEDSMHDTLKILQQRLEAINGDLTNFKIERNGDTLDVEYESTDPNSQFRGDERGIIASPSTEAGDPQVNIDGNEMTVEKAVAFLNGGI
mgnify:FL=1|jgi:hypothetical protein